MTTLTEVLPRTKTGPAAIRWCPADPNDPFAPPTPQGATLPPSGTLVIDQRRASVGYLVTEYPTGWDGRGFRLDKTPLPGTSAAGTDAESESYDVFVGRSPTDRLCQCKGFERWGHVSKCKHVLACEALIANGWL